MTTVSMDYLVVIPPSAKGLQGEGKSLSLLTSCGRTHMQTKRIYKKRISSFVDIVFLYALKMFFLLQT